MSEKINPSPWYKIENNNVKIKSDVANKYGIASNECVRCEYIIISKPYQYRYCGSRYCNDCFDLLDDKYYCEVCKIDDPDNVVHSKENVYEDKALVKDLERSIFTCPDCQLKMATSKLENHVKHCDKGWIACLQCNEMIIKTIKHECDPNSSNQSQTKYKTCPSCGKECLDIKEHSPQCTINWNKGFCPYGCSESGVNHRKEAYLLHLDKTWALLQTHGLGEFGHEDSPKYKKMLKHVVDNVREMTSIDKDGVEKLQNEVKSLNSVMEKETAIYNDIKKTLRSQIADSLTMSFDGTILWKIEFFDDVKANAVSGKQKSIFSPPFFTSRFGYKMCLRLYPNGDSTAWGIGMSLFLVIMKGNYDSLLNWPFKQKVTFILLDQEFKTNMIDAFVPSSNLSSFGRPRTDMNIPSGSSYFIKFEDMISRRYVKDNTIFIRCIIDCSDLHE